MNFRNAYKIILAITLATGIFFIFGELIIRIYLKYNTVYDIEMTQYAMNVKVDSDNPLIGHVHKPNTTERLMNTTVHINSDGLRDKEYPVPRNIKYRVMFLGDSLTFGWGVEQKDSFADILEEKLNNRYPAEIINFGAGNYNTEQEVNLFIEKGLKYKPDRVVVFYFINDAEITPKKSRWWFLGHSQLLSFYWSRINAFINKRFPSQSFREYYAELYEENQTGWINAKKAFLQLKAICRKENIELQVVLLPELHDVKNRIFDGVYKKVSEFLKSNDIIHLNLASIFLNYKNPIELWVSYDDAHPNKLAHKVIAENSLDFILNKGDQNRNEKFSE